MFTAIPPARHRVTKVGRKLRADAKLLTEVLGDSEYETAAIVSGAYLDPSYGFGQGFDTYGFSPALGGHPESGVTSPQVEKSAREWLKKWKEGADGWPFFFVPSLSPHRTEETDLPGPQDYPSFHGLVEDPNKQNDLALEREQEVDAMKLEIKRFLRGDASPAISQPGEVSEKQLEQLRSLGYVN